MAKAKTIKDVLKNKNFHKRVELKRAMIAGLDCTIGTYNKIAELQRIPSPYEREGIVRLLQQDILFGNVHGQRVVHKLSIHQYQEQMLVSDLIGGK